LKIPQTLFTLGGNLNTAGFSRYNLHSQIRNMLLHVGVSLHQFSLQTVTTDLKLITLRRKFSAASHSYLIILGAMVQSKLQSPRSFSSSAMGSWSGALLSSARMFSATLANFTYYEGKHK
jgi:hypothetical protein